MGMPDGSGFAWKDAFGTLGAFVGMISAVVTTIGVIAAYKLKKAESVSPAAEAVQLLSLQERRSLNWAAAVFKASAYGGVVFVPSFAIVMWWAGVPWSMSFLFLVPVFAAAALNVFLLTKLRGDLSNRSSRTKYGTTATVRASYETVFSKCRTAVIRLKAKFIVLDFENGVIESERQSFWRTPFKLNVKISRIDADRCSVYVESDAVVPTASLILG
jgi:hypothetical protein